MRVPGGFRLVSGPGATALLRDDLGDVPLSAFVEDGRPLDGAHGRGVVMLHRFGSGDGTVAAVRRYLRGGALRRVLPDLFLSRRRAFAELAVLAEMRRRGVAVVEPLAAIARSRGPLFELRLATRLVEGALPLPRAAAVSAAARHAAVRSAGRVVRAAFDAGLVHPDLHPANLIVVPGADSGEWRVFLLDLDGAVLREHVDQARRDRMLLRMARYLSRHRAELPLAPSVVDHVRFLRGYGLDRAGRRESIARLAPRLRRALSWRGLD